MASPLRKKGGFKVIFSKKTDQAYWLAAGFLALILVGLVIWATVSTAQTLRDAFRLSGGAPGEVIGFKIIEAGSLNRLKFVSPGEAVSELTPSPVTATPLTSPLPTASPLPTISPVIR